jgi:hypothetical protein
MVEWKILCRLKDRGGLGIKNLDKTHKFAMQMVVELENYEGL